MQIGKLVEDALLITIPFGNGELDSGGSLGIAVDPDDDTHPNKSSPCALRLTLH
jgi:hypothetical protein